MSAKGKILKQKRREQKSPKALHIFGSDHPQGVPQYFFHRAIELDFDSAERADISKQDYSVAPRHWYIDATFVCQKCEKQFVWTRAEQRYWFEELQLWIDSSPFLCRECRSRLREITSVRRAYDDGIAIALSSRDASVKDALCKVIREYEALAGVLSPRMASNLALLERQIHNLSDDGK